MESRSRTKFAKVAKFPESSNVDDVQKLRPKVFFSGLVAWRVCHLRRSCIERGCLVRDWPCHPASVLRGEDGQHRCPLHIRCMSMSAPSRRKNGIVLRADLGLQPLILACASKGFTVNVTRSFSGGGTRKCLSLPCHSCGGNPI